MAVQLTDCGTRGANGVFARQAAEAERGRESARVRHPSTVDRTARDPIRKQERAMRTRVGVSTVGGIEDTTAVI